MSSPGGQALDVNEAIDEAIRQALSESTRYNYASVEHGAFIDNDLTSDTYHPTPAAFGFLDPWFHILRAWGLMDRGQPPEIALETSTEPHECWPIRGDAGILAIKFGYDIYVEGIAVDHVSRDVALDRSVAPKRMQLWGLIAEDDYKHNVEDISDMQLTLKSVDELHQRGPQALLLADFMYDANKQKSLQSFSVLGAIQFLNVTFSEVLVEILSNWGFPESTCLYSIRITGRRVYNHLHYE